ncbi:GroES-like protein [Epithele typhae]|uniref:GroES-like protein n=1 Tax=Epithele typhae TaxID=378194 RepID=UPI0020086F4E|nr:GroES-like protein [Epithele typhae]KAH9921177.1 GroES-like protein [Epithele typhae]
MSLLTQKALVHYSKGGDFVVGDVPIPVPGPHEVLVKVMAVALNPVDWMNQAEAYFTPSYPFIAGMDGAGIVEHVGAAVTTLVKGDKILFQGDFNNDHGTFQQFCLVPAEIAAKIPEGITFEQAATIPLGLGTAFCGLWNHDPAAKSIDFPAPWEEGGAKFKGKPALILGGASSVGQYAIQLAKLAGFSPIVTSASPRNAKMLRAIGATHVFDRALSNDDALAMIRTATAGEAVTFAYDAVSRTETASLAYDALASDGALLLVLPDVLPADKRANGDTKKVVSVYGVVHPPENRKIGVEVFSRVTGWLETGVLVPNKVELLPGGLSGIPDGLRRMKENKVSGMKLVALPQETA